MFHCRSPWLIWHFSTHGRMTCLANISSYRVAIELFVLCIFERLHLSYAKHKHTPFLLNELSLLICDLSFRFTFDSALRWLFIVTVRYRYLGSFIIVQNFFPRLAFNSSLHMIISRLASSVIFRSELTLTSSLHLRVSLPMQIIFSCSANVNILNSHTVLSYALILF